MSLNLASYNIHRCYGWDGLYDPLRIRKVLRELGTQIIALQEVELLHDQPGLLEFFCEDSPWQAVHGLTLVRDTGHYGNALLTSLPIQSVQRIDLSVPGREPRGALSVILEYQGVSLKIIATHLGLRSVERRDQIQRLLNILKNSDIEQSYCTITVLMGDLNEWFLWRRPLQWLYEYFQQTQTPASYPACCPFFALDRIWVKPYDVLVDIQAVKNKLTRIASDHLPLLARLKPV